MSVLDVALANAAAGRHVFPVHGVTGDGDCTCSEPRCSSPGKHPTLRRGHLDATTNSDTIRAWSERSAGENLGWSLERSGFFVLDMDPRHGGLLVLHRAGDLPREARCTGGRGRLALGFEALGASDLDDDGDVARRSRSGGAAASLAVRGWSVNSPTSPTDWADLSALPTGSSSRPRDAC